MVLIESFFAGEVAISEIHCSGFATCLDHYLKTGDEESELMLCKSTSFALAQFAHLYDAVRLMAKQERKFKFN